MQRSSFHKELKQNHKLLVPTQTLPGRMERTHSTQRDTLFLGQGSVCACVHGGVCKNSGEISILQRQAMFLTFVSSSVIMIRRDP